jgi:hypothetical protein
MDEEIAHPRYIRRCHKQVADARCGQDAGARQGEFDRLAIVEPGLGLTLKYFFH